MIVDALRKVVGNGDFSRSRGQELVDAVQQMNVHGVSGYVLFDQFGGTTNKELSSSQT